MLMRCLANTCVNGRGVLEVPAHSVPGPEAPTVRGLRTLPNELLARCPGAPPCVPGSWLPQYRRSEAEVPKGPSYVIKFSCSENMRGLPVRKPTHLRHHPPPISFTEQTAHPLGISTQASLYPLPSHTSPSSPPPGPAL